MLLGTYTTIITTENGTKDLKKNTKDKKAKIEYHRIQPLYC